MSPPEPWLSGPIDGVPPLLMPVAHALIGARDDAQSLASALPDGSLWARPTAAASPGFHLFHAAGALDRLFAYARGESLSDVHRAHFELERAGGDTALSVADLLALFSAAIDRALIQLRATSAESLLDPRRVGRAGLPSNVLGLLFHAAEHTARHVGQCVTTAKFLTAATASSSAAPQPAAPPAISTPRLLLLPASLAALRAARSGRAALSIALAADIPDSWPHEFLDDAALAFIERRLAEHPGEAAWWMYFILLRSYSTDSPPTLLGTCGYKGPPSGDGAVEIGYGIVSEHQRRGFASEAARALVDAAFRRPEVRRVLAETLPELVGSIGVLEKCNFRPAGPGSEPGVLRFAITREEYDALRLVPVDVAAALSRFTELWSPRIAGELNGQHVKLAKLQGEFVWHHHEHEDELFYVVRGRLEMHLRDRVITLLPGQFLVVPRGVEHKPVAPEETHILLFEPASTLNTGNVKNERTREKLERLS